MITLFSGTLGSGKTYKMVAELSRCKDKYYVVHNIEHLQEGYLKEYGVNWIEYCKAQNLEVSEFFSKDYQLEYSKAIFEKYKRPALIIIDEAHEWFDRHVKAFKMWLSYSRHLDQDIWLVAHSSMNIPAIYRSFVGVEYRAKSGAFFILPKYFFYNRILGGQRAGYTFERKDKKIFNLYKSKEINNDKKPKMSMMLPAMIIFAIIGVAVFFMLPSKAMNHTKKIDDVKKNINSGAAAQIVAAVVVSDSIENNYAFVGDIAGKIILEDRKSGVQFPLNILPGGWKLVKFDKVAYCQIFNGLKIITLNNFNRFIPVPSGHGDTGYMFAGNERHQSEAPANGLVTIDK